MEFPPYTKTVHRTVYPAIEPKHDSAAGKVVVVTGGGAGIGKAIAEAFVEAGAKAVAILGRREEVLHDAAVDLQSKGSSKILPIPVDILDKAALDSAFQKVAEQEGKIDVLVANAGYLPTPGPAATSDVTDWWTAFEVNVKGTLLTFQAWHPYIGSNSPTFIALNTAAAHIAGFPNFSSYAGSKAAQLQVVTAIQAENPNIRAVSFHPGAVETPMYTKSALPIPPGDIRLPAAFTVWCASAPEWVKGRMLWSKWDVNELEAMKDNIIAQDELKLGLQGWPKQYA